MLEAVVTDLRYESGDEVAIMVNGLGRTPISELYLIDGHVRENSSSAGSGLSGPTLASTARRWKRPACH